MHVYYTWFESQLDAAIDRGLDAEDADDPDPYYEGTCYIFAVKKTRPYSPSNTNPSSDQKERTSSLTAE